MELWQVRAQNSPRNWPKHKGGKSGVGEGVKKVEKNKFSELGLPGVEIVGAPLETLFTLSRAP